MTAWGPAKPLGHLEAAVLLKISALVNTASCAIRFPAVCAKTRPAPWNTCMPFACTDRMKNDIWTVSINSQIIYEQLGGFASFLNGLRGLMVWIISVKLSYVHELLHLFFFLVWHWVRQRTQHLFTCTSPSAQFRAKKMQKVPMKFLNQSLSCIIKQYLEPRVPNKQKVDVAVEIFLLSNRLNSTQYLCLL